MTNEIRKGFRVPCIRCGETWSVRVDLDDATGVSTSCPSFSCYSCEAEWSAADVRRLIDRWAKALAWLDTAPVLGEEGE